MFKNIRAVNHCHVTWEHFSSKPGPMQCKRCQLFGHGAANSNRSKCCYLCGGEHETIICPLAAGPFVGDGRVPRHTLRCVNCSGNHTARFHECPKRPVRNTTVMPNKKQSYRNTTVSVGDFPSLPQAPPLQGWRQRSPILQDTITSIPLKRNTNIDLSEQSELIPIIEEIINKLHQCNSKTEQLMVIFDITTKYCCPSKWWFAIKISYLNANSVLNKKMITSTNMT